MTQFTIAFLVLSFDIAIVFSGLQNDLFSGILPLGVFLPALGFGAAATATGFVAHELAHKITAERLGFWSEFRLSTFGLFLSIITSLFGFLFALPGATVIGGPGSVRDWGRTSIAGPLTNLAEGGAFLAAGVVLALFTPFALGANIVLFLAFFNGWFATFNLIPFGPLDGRKVLAWSWSIWLVAFLVSAALAAGTYAVAFLHVPL